MNGYFLKLLENNPKFMSLKITGLSLDILWKNKNANYKAIEDSLANEDADLLLLPEMFSTGFCMEAQEIADRNEETLSWMKSFAKTKNTAVAGSASVADENQFFNRFFFVFPDGKYEYYDKRHLFSYSKENEIYSPGNTRKTIEYKGIKILLQVCYDLRFPVFSRNNDDYHLALYIASWPGSRIEMWQTLLRARAIENQVYIFGLNRMGTDGKNLFYPESSHCFFADGNEVSQKHGNIISSEIHLEDLKNFRNQFPFLKDQDNFELKW